MKKKTLFVAILIITLIITGCGKKKTKEYKLVVKSADWSGWTETYEPDVVTDNITPEKGKRYTIRKNSGFSIKIEIVSIKDNSITFKTSEPLSSSGSILEYESEFTIKVGESITLNTLTMDAGCTYDITFK